MTLASLSSLLQPRARGTSLEGLLLHGLQGALGGINLLLDLLEGVRLPQHLVPLTSHEALLSVSNSRELGQDVASLRLPAAPDHVHAAIRCCQ